MSNAPAPAGRRRALAPTLATLAGLMVLGSVFVNLWTSRLWYKSVDYSGVFTTVIGSRVALFAIFGVVTAAIVGVNLYLAYRVRPDILTVRSGDPAARYRYALTPVLRLALLVVMTVALVFGGTVGQAQWERFQLWRNGTSFGSTDPQFGRDISFYVFDLPWWSFLISFFFGILILTMIATVFVHYVFGGVMLTAQNRGPRFSRGAQVHIACLAGLIVLVKAVDYWLSRFEYLVGDGGLVDGALYTDINARIPGRNILLAAAIVCAILFFSSIFLKSWTLPVIGLGGLLVTSILVGGVWPAIMQRFQVLPSEADREEPYIARNIEATREAYGVADAESVAYTARTSLSPVELNESAESRVSTRLLDPTLISPAFQQLQQVRGYYTVQETLDVDRYRIGDEEQTQDVIIAAREVDLDGLNASQRSWSSDHTVYTHGYGVIAARGNQRGPQGEPVWVAKDIPPTGEFDFSIPPRIYFGEKSPIYSIVGRPDGSSPVEVDTPRGGSSSTGEDGDDETTANTYDGAGGVPIGNLFNQMLYAIKFTEPNIVLSDRVNSNSKILYDRHPRERVMKVAPWLEVDGDPYPAVVEGRVVWILDGYTTSNSYPYSQHKSLNDSTSDTLTEGQSQVALPTDNVNYMRNSVKAVVDAYDGTVMLYEWDEEDPVLKTWSKVFPDVIQAKSTISDDLMAHLRYPVDQFKVQRDVLTRYHVTNPQTFYEDGERWRVPEDPSTRGSTKQPPYYLSMTRPGEEQVNFSLTSVFIPNSRQNLASFVSVNSEATSEDFGKIQILELPSDTPVGGPSLIANQFSTDTAVTQALLPFKQSDATVLNGNLLTLPVGGGLLYVQPVYIRRSATEGTYPVLQFIIASFGGDVGIGQTLDQALRVALGLDAAPEVDPDDVEPPAGGETPEPGEPAEPGEPPTAPSDASAEQLLRQATDAYEAAQAALENGNLAQYQRKIDEMAELLTQAQEKLDAAGNG